MGMKKTPKGSTLLWPQLKPHEGQAALWTCPERFVYVPCGRQSGKTELALRRLVRYLPVKRPWPDPKFFYAGPTYQQAKRTAWSRLLRLIPPEWIFEISKSELSIRTIFGSEIFLVGLDKPQRIEGLILDGGVIDECSDIKPKTFDLSILPTLVMRNGWVWFIGVPKRFGIGAIEYRERYKAAAAGTLANSRGFSWPSSGIVPEEYLDHCQRTMDIRDYQEQFEASWLTATGGIFHAFDPEFNVRPCNYDPSLPIVVCQDFNVNPMAWSLGHMKGTTLEIFDEIFIRNTNTPETLRVLLGRYREHKGGFEFYGDASSRGNRTSAYSSDYNHIANGERLKAMGRTMHYMYANPPIADRFAATNARICDGEGNQHIYIDKTCIHLILDLETRAYKPNSREAADSGDIGHCSDGLGYFCHKRFPLLLKVPKANVVTITTGRQVA